MVIILSIIGLIILFYILAELHSINKSYRGAINEIIGEMKNISNAIWEVVTKK